MSTFPWLDPTRASGASSRARRTDAAVREVRDRAGVYYRLGFTAKAAAARLAAAIAWEYEAPAARPAELSDGAIATLVAEAYARRPA